MPCDGTASLACARLSRCCSPCSCHSGLIPAREPNSRAPTVRQGPSQPCPRSTPKRRPLTSRARSAPTRRRSREGARADTATNSPSAYRGPRSWLDRHLPHHGTRGAPGPQAGRAVWMSAGQAIFSRFSFVLKRNWPLLVTRTPGTYSSGRPGPTPAHARPTHENPREEVPASATPPALPFHCLLGFRTSRLLGARDSRSRRRRGPGGRGRGCTEGVRACARLCVGGRVERGGGPPESPGTRGSLRLGARCPSASAAQTVLGGAFGTA